MESVGSPEADRSPPLARSDATHHVRRFLTPLHGVSLAAEDMEREDAQGTLTLWFHENRDKAGNPSTKVFGVTNCHVLRRNPTVDYEHTRWRTYELSLNLLRSSIRSRPR